MSILISKILSYLTYPMGIITLLITLAICVRLFGWVRRARFLVFLSVLVLLTTSSPRLASWLASNLESQYPPVAIQQLPQSEVLVMLGGALVAPKAPRLEIELVGSSDRILHTSRIFKQGKVKRVFLSGGNVFDGFLPKSESEYVKTLLVEWGIPGGKIEIGTNSKTTYQNALETRDYLTRKGWINKPIILVTSAIHMPRAVETFRAASIRVTPASTDILVTKRTSPEVLSWIPSAGALALSTAAIHELVGLWYYRLRGWARGV